MKVKVTVFSLCLVWQTPTERTTYTLEMNLVSMHQKCFALGIMESLTGVRHC